MTVSEKMSYVLNKVLQTEGYLVKITNRNRWDVLFNGEAILQTV